MWRPFHIIQLRSRSVIWFWFAVFFHLKSSSIKRERHSSALRQAANDESASEIHLIHTSFDRPNFWQSSFSPLFSLTELRNQIYESTRNAHTDSFLEKTTLRWPWQSISCQMLDGGIHTKLAMMQRNPNAAKTIFSRLFSIILSKSRDFRQFREFKKHIKSIGMSVLLQRRLLS